jgi:hypothetical protein
MLAGFLAGACRPNGFLLSIPIGALLFGERPFVFDRRRAGLLFAAASPFAGMAAFFAYSWAKLGDPLLPVEIQRTGWLHALSWPWMPLVHAIVWKPRAPFAAVAILGFGAIAAFLWRRSRGESLYVLATLLMPCLSGGISSAPRYVLVLFPAFFLLGEWIRKSRPFEVAYTTAGLFGLAYFTARFALGFWVA